VKSLQDASSRYGTDFSALGDDKDADGIREEEEVETSAAEDGSEKGSADGIDGMDADAATGGAEDDTHVDGGDEEDDTAVHDTHEELEGNPDDACSVDDNDAEALEATPVAGGSHEVLGGSPETEDVNITSEGNENSQPAVADREEEGIEDPADGGSEPARVGGKLTAKQRRVLKKLKGKEAVVDLETVRSVRGMVTPKTTEPGALEESVQANKQAKKKEKEKPEPPPAVAVPSKKKFVNKKKAKRYANQDEEDISLAMQALGHSLPGEAPSDKQKVIDKEEKTKDLKERQQKAGVRSHDVAKEWDDATGQLHELPREALRALVSSGQLTPGEIDAFEVTSLGSFPPEDALKIVSLMAEGGKLKKVGNKSGFLAGIMRRFTKEAQKNAAVGASLPVNSEGGGGGTAGEESEVADVAVGSRRERKKLEAAEVQAILEEEGALEEEEGKQADELEKLTGCPVSDDVLLYAVPVCGPYPCMQNYKYRVKLTPGTTKKGKAAKQALEVFSRSKECSVSEKTLLKGLTDPEMVAILIGDVKVSTPGITAVKKQMKGKSGSKHRE